MQDFINWVSEYSVALDFVQVIVSVATAIAAFVLVYVTWVLASATKRKPFVVGYLESTAYHPRYVNFVLINTGTAPAFDININIIPALPNIDGTPREGETETNRSVLILPPNQKMPFRGFDSVNATIKKFDVIVSWCSEAKGGEREILKHSISVVKNKAGWREKGLDEIAREFEKTSAHLKEIAQHLKPPQNKK